MSAAAEYEYQIEANRVTIAELEAHQSKDPMRRLGWSKEFYIEQIQLLDSLGIAAKNVLSDGYIPSRRHLLFRLMVQKGDNVDGEKVVRPNDRAAYIEQVWNLDTKKRVS